MEPQQEILCVPMSSDSDPERENEPVEGKKDSSFTNSADQNSIECIAHRTRTAKGSIKRKKRFIEEDFRISTGRKDKRQNGSANDTSLEECDAKEKSAKSLKKKEQSTPSSSAKKMFWSREEEIEFVSIILDFMKKGAHPIHKIHQILRIESEHWEGISSLLSQRSGKSRTPSTLFWKMRKLRYSYGLGKNAFSSKDRSEEFYELMTQLFCPQNKLDSASISEQKDAMEEPLNAEEKVLRLTPEKVQDASEKLTEKSDVSSEKVTQKAEISNKKITNEIPVPGGNTEDEVQVSSGKIREEVQVPSEIAEEIKVSSEKMPEEKYVSNEKTTEEVSVSSEKMTEKVQASDGKMTEEVEGSSQKTTKEVQISGENVTEAAKLSSNKITQAILVCSEKTTQGVQVRNEEMMDAVVKGVEEDQSLSLKRGIASAILESVKSGNGGVNDIRDVFLVKTSCAFWENATNIFQMKTGQSVSKKQIIDEFKEMEKLYVAHVTQKGSSALNKSEGIQDEQLLECLHQIFGQYIDEVVTGESCLGPYQSKKKLNKNDEAGTHSVDVGSNAIAITNTDDKNLHLEKLKQDVRINGKKTPVPQKEPGNEDADQKIDRFGNTNIANIQSLTEKELFELAKGNLASSISNDHGMAKKSSFAASTKKKTPRTPLPAITPSAEYKETLNNSRYHVLSLASSVQKLKGRKLNCRESSNDLDSAGLAKKRKSSKDFVLSKIPPLENAESLKQVHHSDVSNSVSTAQHLSRINPIRWTSEDEIVIASCVLDARKKGMLHKNLESNRQWKSNLILWEEVRKQVRQKTRKVCTADEASEKFLEMKGKFLRHIGAAAGKRDSFNLGLHEKKLFNIFQEILSRTVSTKTEMFAETKAATPVSVNKTCKSTTSSGLSLKPLLSADSHDKKQKEKDIRVFTEPDVRVEKENFQEVLSRSVCTIAETKAATAVSVNKTCKSTNSSGLKSLLSADSHDKKQKEKDISVFTEPDVQDLSRVVSTKTEMVAEAKAKAKAATPVSVNKTCKSATSSGLKPLLSTDSHDKKQKERDICVFTGPDGRAEKEMAVDVLNEQMEDSATVKSDKLEGTSKVNNNNNDELLLISKEIFTDNDQGKNRYKDLTEHALSLYHKLWTDCEKRFQEMESRIIKVIEDKFDELKKAQQNRDTDFCTNMVGLLGGECFDLNAKDSQMQAFLEKKLKTMSQSLEIKQQLLKLEKEETERQYSLYKKKGLVP